MKHDPTHVTRRVSQRSMICPVTPETRLEPEQKEHAQAHKHTEFRFTGLAYKLLRTLQ